MSGLKERRNSVKTIFRYFDQENSGLNTISSFSEQRMVLVIINYENRQ
jgi:hypothetical protein